MINKRLKNEAGMTAISWVAILAVFAFFVLIALKLVPIYLEHFSVSSSLESLQEVTKIEEKTPGEIKDLLQKRFQINNINRVNRSHIKVGDGDKGLDISIIYEVREPLIGNVDAVVSFSDSVTIKRQ